MAPTPKQTKTIGKNISATLEGTTLTLVIDIGKDYGLSSSGKSRIIASSEGNQAAPGDAEIKIGLNIYRRA
jgi:hypothetical protein